MAILSQENISTLQRIPEGAGGVAATLDCMVRLTKQYKTDPAIRATAERIVDHVPGKDYRAEIAAVQNWVRDNIRYTMDVRDVETLKIPPYVMASYHGDCDDQALLVATLLESLGYKTRFVAVGFEGPSTYSHVFAEVLLGTRWLSVETTENVLVGWTPEHVTSRMIRHV